MQDRIVRLEVTLFGPTGNNGVVGNQKSLIRDVGDIKATLATIRTILVSMKWAILGLNVLFVLVAPEKLAGILRHLATITKEVSGLIK